MDNRAKFPDFLCIGAQKAGTTWLYNNLRKHPDISMPEVKEFHYFNAREVAFTQTYWQRILAPQADRAALQGFLDRWRTPIFRQHFNQALASGNLLKASRLVSELFHFNSDDLYRSAFASHTSEIAGDITPEYSVLEQDSIEYIHTIMPHAKVIFIIRNPIDRAWSHARMFFSRRGIDLDSLSEDDFIKQFNLPSSRKRSDYMKILERWRSYYPEEQIHLCFFDDLANRPRDFVSEICNFLELKDDAEFLNNVSTGKVNSYASDRKGQLSQNLKKYLAELYYSDLKDLSLHLGQHSTDWLESAEEILKS